MRKVILVVILFLSQSIWSQYSINSYKPLEKALYLEFVNNTGTSYGSGFLIQHDFTNQSYFYLITARHVLGKFNSERKFIIKDKIFKYFILWKCWF